MATPVPTAVTSVATPAATVTASRASIALPSRLPPAGGLTVGLVSGLSPRAVVAAQAFEVTSLAVYDTATRRFLTYIPGSPFNTIGEDPLPLNSAVFIRRQGERGTNFCVVREWLRNSLARHWPLPKRPRTAQPSSKRSRQT